MRELVAGTIKAASGSIANLGFYAVSIKVLASFLGPQGVGLFSLLRQIQATAVTLATFNGTTALVRSLASKRGRVRQRFLASALLLCLAGACAVVVTLSLAPSAWAGWLLAHSDGEATRQIMWVACATVCGVAWVVVAGVLNGTRNLGGLAWAQGLGAACLAFVVYPVVVGVHAGATYLLPALLCVAPAASASIGAWLVVHREEELPLRRAFWQDWDHSAAKEFLVVSLAMLVAGFLLSLVQLVVKRLVLGRLGLAAVGIYDAAWNLSNTYVLIVLSSLVTYYLPALAGTPDSQDRQKLLSQTLRLSVAMMVPLLVAIVALAPLIVRLLYSREFLASVDIVRWNLIGDYFKTISFVLGYSVLARADMRLFLFVEIVFDGVFLSGSFLAVRSQWLPGLGVAHTLAHAASAILYLAVHIWRYRVRLEGSLLALCGIGLGLVSTASWANWRQSSVSWGAVLFWSAVGLLWIIALLQSLDKRIAAFFPTGA